MTTRRCNNCGHEREAEYADACLSFGGRDSLAEARRGIWIDPCRGTMLADGETAPVVEPCPPLDLKITVLDLSTTTYKVTDERRWTPIKWPPSS